MTATFTPCRSALLAILIALPSPNAHAISDPTPGGVSANTVKLPSAPGSYEGLGNAGEVSAFSGQYGYSLPLDLPMGRGGVAPSLALAYSGALGNGVLGIGWGLDAPHLSRSTRLGVPRFNNDDELELTGLGGGGRLLRVEQGPFAGEYRVEGRGHDIRVREVVGGYRVDTNDGTRWDLDVRVDRPDARGGGTFAWYASQSTALNGESIRFEYDIAWGNARIDRVAWGPSDGDEQTFSADFEYEARPDIVASHIAGFDRRIVSRLKSIVIRSFGAIRKTYHLDFTSNVPFTRLSSVTVTGAEPDETALPPTTFAYGEAVPPSMYQPTGMGGWRLNERGTTLLDVDGDGLSDLVRFEVGERSWCKNWGDHFDEPKPLPGAALRPLDEIRLLDLDGDLRPEMIYQVDDTWRVYRLADGPDGVRFVAFGEPQISIPGIEIPGWPGSDGVAPVSRWVDYADINGDGRTDVVEPGYEGPMVRWAEPLALTRPVLKGAISIPDGHVELGANNVQLHDLYGDGLADVFWLGDAYFKTYLGLGDGTFETQTQVWCWPWNWIEAEGRCRVEDPVALDASQIRFVDLNRDGILDLVRVANKVTFYPGRFSERQAMAGATEIMPFGAPVVLPKPNGAEYDDVVTLADMNGNGTQDVVWSTPYGLWALDLAGTATEAMLTRIENGLGFETAITYTTSTLLSLGAEAASAPWTFKLASTMAVPYEVTTRVPLDPEHPVVTTRYTVKDGFWDATERRFGGFLQASSMALGETAAETLVVTTDFERGVGMSRVLRGTPLRVVRADGAGKVFDEVVSVLDAIAVTDLDPSDELSIDKAAWFRRAVEVQKDTTVFEGLCPGESDEIRYLRETFEHDGYGNRVRATNLGRVDAGGDDIEGDEVVSVSRYVPTTLTESDEPWLHFAACESQVVEADGTTLRGRSVTVFDDGGAAPSSVAIGTRACVGTIADGRPRASFGYLDESPGRWVRLSETEYDTWGNPIASESGGVRREVEWDSDGLFPLSESLPDAPNVPLSWEVVTWDKTLGVPLRVRDADGRESAVEVDALGRVVGVDSDVYGTGVLERVAETTYNLVGPRPSITSIVHEGGAIPDVTTTSVVTAGGAPLFSAVADGAGGWLVNGYRMRNRLGLTTEYSQPFEFVGESAASLPTSRPVGVAVQKVQYDAMRRATRVELPPWSRAASATGGPLGLSSDVTSSPVVSTTTFKPLKTIGASTDQAEVVREQDGLGRLASISRVVPDRWSSDAPVLERSTATWDAAGRMLTWAVEGPSPGSSIVASFAYDSLGRFVEGSDPDAGTRHHVWNDAGQLIETENAVGGVAQFGYDAVGRLVSRRGISSGYDETWSFHYDADPFAGGGGSDPSYVGRLAATDGPDGRIQFGYDSLGRVVSQTRAIIAHGESIGSAHSVTWGTTFSWGGKSLASRLSQGATERIRLESDYDAMGRLRWLGYALEGASTADVLWEVLALTPAGGSLLERTGNGLVTGVGRDVVDQMTSLSIRKVSGVGSAWDRDTHAVDVGVREDLEDGFAGAGPSDTRYGLSAIVRNGYGAVRWVEDEGAGLRSSVFEYDQGTRLTKASVAGYGFEYGYDRLQNLTKRVTAVVPGGAMAPELQSGTYSFFSGTRRASGISDGLTSTSFAYDAGGRTTSIVDGAGTTVMAWDAFDRKRVVDQPGSGQTAHRYGADGERATTTWASGEVERYFGGGLTERDGRLELHVGLGGPRQVARLNVPWAVGGSLGAVEQSVVYLHQGFGHGPSLVTDTAGDVLEERFHEPYGAAIWAPIDVGLERVGWNGKPVDPNTGWSDHGARWHATRYARWLSTDPPLWGPEGWAEHGLGATPFGFVAGNPVMAWDPDGQQPATWNMPIPLLGGFGGTSAGVRTVPATVPVATPAVAGTRSMPIPTPLGAWTNPWAGNSINVGMRGEAHPSKCRTVGPPCGAYGGLDYDPAEKRAYDERQREKQAERESAALWSDIGFALMFGAKNKGARGATASVGGSAAGGGTGWTPGPNDLDWRGTGRTQRDAVDEAFRRTGVPRGEFEITKWGRDVHGKSFPVEWRARGGAEVNVDRGHTTYGPEVPHIGYQTPGSRSEGSIRGHILLDDVNANR